MSIVIDERQDRIRRLASIRERGISPYADRFNKVHKTIDIQKLAIGHAVSTAGRIVLFRDMGKIAFLQIQDFVGRAQIVFKIDHLGEDAYKALVKIVNVGDFIGIEGSVFKTQKGEISVLADKYTYLSKSLRPLPEKWHGLKDAEIKYRQRYLDLIANQDVRDRFKFRTDFIWELRKFYQENGFLEVETPVLTNAASGALAKPFVTHHNALGLDVFLRIAPEIYLKEAIIGGYEKIFEVARVFRNEGMDSSHLQDFTMVEHYAAYWDYKDNMAFTEKMLPTIIQKLKGTTTVDILNRDGNLIAVDFKPPWDILSFRELLLKDCDIDIEAFPTADELRREIKNKKIIIDDIDNLGRGNLIDVLYKAVSRSKITKPTFLIHHPIDLSPLARRNDAQPVIADRFQLVVNGWEVINAYSELIDPIDQKERLDRQAEAKQMGDDEAMSKDDEYVKAMEYGMPPVSGWGMGIERIIALLSQQSNLKDVVLFPLTKPEN
jgi:lysyl-tRNA synthetase class 2